MAVKSTDRSGKPQKKKSSDVESAFWDLPLGGWLKGNPAGGFAATPGLAGRLIFAGCGNKAAADEARNKQIAAKLGDAIPSWQKQWLSRKTNEVLLFAEAETPIWVLRPKSVVNSSENSQNSEYGAARNLAGSVISAIVEAGISSLHVEFLHASDVQILGVLAGLEIGSYKYNRVKQPKPDACLPELIIHGDEQQLAGAIEMASALGISVNIARHLVNTPAGELNPATYADSVSKLFAGARHTTVEVWDEKRLKSEGMGLLLAVGQGALNTSRLVHIKYRPAGKTRFAQPLAFVGKGVTFDTGGLDIKPSSGMRLMKKDMGGSAALVGLAWYLEQSGVDVPCDIWLALAENAVSDRSFRPGDVVVARNGLRVEIHNTDAEGRLVMADAMDVAVSRDGSDAPLALIDVSTLTGAMRVALGTSLAGMFSTSDKLANEMVRLGKVWGDPVWRMPLWEDYKSALRSNCGDLTNCADGPFGGAITAALFLQRFVKQVPWLHFDVFTWADKVQGCMAEVGGSGQPVQLLVGFIEAAQESWFEGAASPSKDTKSRTKSKR